MEEMTMLQNLFEGIEGLSLNTHILLYAVFIGIVIDFVTGIAKGYKIDGRPSSKKLRDGGFKKAGILLIIFLSYGLSVLLNDVNRIIFNSVMVYYIYMELISILENLEALGVQLPKIFVKILGELNEGEE